MKSMTSRSRLVSSLINFIPLGQASSFHIKNDHNLELRVSDYGYDVEMERVKSPLTFFICRCKGYTLFLFE